MRLFLNWPKTREFYLIYLFLIILPVYFNIWGSRGRKRRYTNNPVLRFVLQKLNSQFTTRAFSVACSMPAYPGQPTPGKRTVLRLGPLTKQSTTETRQHMALQSHQHRRVVPGVVARRLPEHTSPSLAASVH